MTDINNQNDTALDLAEAIRGCVSAAEGDLRTLAAALEQGMPASARQALGRVQQHIGRIGEKVELILIAEYERNE